MQTFIYKGNDEAGNSVTETVTAEDRFAVYEIARQNHHTIESIVEQKHGTLSHIFNMEAINAFLSRVKTDELVLLTRNLGSMLKAGLSLSRALGVLERQTKNPRLKMILDDVVTKINEGLPFYQALEKYPKVFDDLYVSMIKAGEESGGMSEALATLSVQMQRSSTLRKKIKGAMIYPIIVIIILVGIGVLMMIYVMPSITATFRDLNAELPATTRALMAASDFMVANTLLVLLGMVGAVAGFVYSLRTKYGHRAASWVIPRLPVIGTMAKETNSARTARTLSSLLGSGVDVMRSLEITADVVQNDFYKEIIAEARERVERGAPLSEIFVERDDLYPVLVGEMIMVGEETGNIASMLEELADFYEKEVEQKTKDLSTIIEPLLMVVIGGTVGLFALAMIAPIYSISDSIG